jgi:hypothetical protein
MGICGRIAMTWDNLTTQPPIHAWETLHDEGLAPERQREMEVSNFGSAHCGLVATIPPLWPDWISGRNSTRGTSNDLGQWSGSS